MQTDRGFRSVPLSVRPTHGGYPDAQPASPPRSTVAELRAGDVLVILMEGRPLTAEQAAAMRERFRASVPMVRDVVFVAGVTGAVVCRGEDGEPAPEPWVEHLLDAFLAGRPLDFRREQVPAWVHARLQSVFGEVTPDVVYQR